MSSSDRTLGLTKAHTNPGTGAQGGASRHMLAVTVLYQDEKFLEPLRAALSVAGAKVHQAVLFEDLMEDRVRIPESDILLVNLEREVAARGEWIDAAVGLSFGGRVIFNDAEAMDELADADRARWIRHLAAKISQQSSLLPPVPETSELEALPPLEEVSQAEDIEVWILAASIGGPEAVRVFLSELEPDPPAAFILVQHIGAEFVDLMISQMEQISKIPVRAAQHGQALRPGELIVVPVGQRMTINHQQEVKLEPLEKIGTYSPCIDDVLHDLTDRFGASTNVIVFSGMAQDGVAGCRHVIENSGEVWVQEPDSCVVSSIVDGALATGKVRVRGEPAELAHKLSKRLEALEQGGTMDSSS